MKFDASSILTTAQLIVGTVLVPALLGWIGKHVRSSKDSARATALQHIADGVAAIVLANNPSNAWAQLLKRTVEALQQAPATPTTNAEVLERAAASALTKLGIKPSRA